MPKEELTITMIEKIVPKLDKTLILT